MATTERTGQEGQGARHPRVPARSHAQHRDHGPHRRGQDHDDRADPLLHRSRLQDRRGPRGHGHDGLDGAGARAGHHDHLGRHHLPVEGPLDQHHRHARPRRLHGRGRAVAPRPRRRGRRVRLGRRRRAAVRDRLAPGRPLRRPAHRLREQDGPHGRELRAHGRDDGRPPRGEPARPAAPVGDRVRPPRRHRPRRLQRPLLGGRHGRGLEGHRDPRGVPRGRDEGPRTTCFREARRARRGPDGEVRARGGAHGRRAPQGDPRDDARRGTGVPGALRLRVQEQGRAARARRDRRTTCPSPLDVPPVEGPPAVQGGRPRRAARRATPRRSPRSRSRSCPTPTSGDSRTCASTPVCSTAART